MNSTACWILAFRTFTTPLPSRIEEITFIFSLQQNTVYTYKHLSTETKNGMFAFVRVINILASREIREFRRHRNFRTHKKAWSSVNHSFRVVQRSLIHSQCMDMPRLLQEYRCRHSLKATTEHVKLLSKSSTINDIQDLLLRKNCCIIDINFMSYIALAQQHFDSKSLEWGLFWLFLMTESVYYPQKLMRFMINLYSHCPLFFKTSRKTTPAFCAGY